MTTGKTIALTLPTFVGKVMSLLFNILSRLVITFLPRSKHLLISWLQSPSAVILEPTKMYHSAVLVIMLYITSLVLTLHWKFVLFYDLPPIPFLPILHSWQLHVYFLWVWFFPRLCTWDHIVFVFLWLISLSIMPSVSIHVVTNGRISSFLWLDNIQLLFHAFFIHSPIKKT